MFSTLRQLARLALVASVAAASLALVGAASAQGKDCPGAPKSRLVVNRGAQVSPGGSPNNLRNQPSKSAAIVQKVQPGTQLYVLAGPTCADNFAWWQVSSDDQTMGWMAEGSGSTYYIDPTTSAYVEAQLPTNAATVDIKFGNFSLAYNGSLGKVVQADTVFAFKGDTSNIPPFAVFPEYTEFVFNPKPNSYYGPSIDIYPVAAYEKLLPMVADYPAQLQKLLNDKPKEIQRDPTKVGIPVLPVANAAQVLAANLKYLTFGGGTGVRFITYYAQDVSPVTNDRIQYYFQGLSADGKYWISAHFPVKSSLLADTYEQAKDFPDPSVQTDGKAFDKYYTDVAAKLNAAQATDFTPSLDKYDTLIQSLTIKQN